MAEQATYVGIQPRSIKASASAAIVRGLRYNRQTDGTFLIADQTTRGQFVAITNSDASTHAVGASLQNGEKVPMLLATAISTTAVGDPAYSAAGGYTTNATGTVLIGQWTTVTAGGTLGVVELFNPA